MDEIVRASADQAPPGRLEETKRIARILRLITLIANAPRQWTRAALSDRLEISERQIDKDLELLRHALCCEIRRARGGYFFTRLPQFPAIAYTATEALALVTALQFARDSGALDAASLGAALARTEEALPAGFAPLLRSMRPAAGGSPRRQCAWALSTMQTALKDRRAVRNWLRYGSIAMTRRRTRSARRVKIETPASGTRRSTTPVAPGQSAG